MIFSFEYLLWLQVFMLMLEDLKTWLILLIEIQMLKLNTSRCQFLRQTLSSKLSQKENSASRLQTVFHNVVSSFGQNAEFNHQKTVRWVMFVIYCRYGWWVLLLWHILGLIWIYIFYLRMFGCSEKPACSYCDDVILWWCLFLFFDCSLRKKNTTRLCVGNVVYRFVKTSEIRYLWSEVMLWLCFCLQY